jgi:hypothetical protein
LLKDFEGSQDETNNRQTQLELQVEQDLEVKPQTKGIQDDKDFEVWFDDVQDDLEVAALEKYTYAISLRCSQLDSTAPSYRNDCTRAM